MGESGCVAWMFESKGVITIAKSVVAEDKLTDLVIDAGADDIKTDDDAVYEIYTSPQALETVKAKITENKIAIESAAVAMIPKNTVKLDGDDAKKCLDFMDALDEHEDVKSVTANFDIDQEVLDKVSQGK